MADLNTHNLEVQKTSPLKSLGIAVFIIIFCSLLYIVWYITREPSLEEYLSEGLKPEQYLSYAEHLFEEEHYLLADSVLSSIPRDSKDYEEVKELKSRYIKNVWFEYSNPRLRKKLSEMIYEADKIPFIQVKEKIEIGRFYCEGFTELHILPNGVARFEQFSTGECARMGILNFPSYDTDAILDGNWIIQWSPNINNSGSEIVIRIKTPGTSDTYGKISNTLDNPYFISIKEFFAAINRKGRYTYHPFILASARDANYDYSNFYTYGESLRNQFMRERDLVRYNNGDFGIK